MYNIYIYIQYINIYTVYIYTYCTYIYMYIGQHPVPMVNIGEHGNSRAGGSGCSFVQFWDFIGIDPHS